MTTVSFLFHVEIRISYSWMQVAILSPTGEPTKRIVLPRLVVTSSLVFTRKWPSTPVHHMRPRLTRPQPAQPQVRQSCTAWSFSFRLDDLCTLLGQCRCQGYWTPQSCRSSCLRLWRSRPASCWHVVCFKITSVRYTRSSFVIREMAVGNTFGATALSSYGGFWLSFAIILTPGGFNIEGALIENGMPPFLNSFGLYLMGWFIFTFLLLICTLRSTIAFFSLFFTLDICFLLLGVGYLQNDGTAPHSGCIKAGGYFGLFAAFLAWYNALAGIADNSNRSVTIQTYTHTLRATTNIPQLLCHPRRTLPLVREGPRKAQGRCRHGIDVPSRKIPRFVLLYSSMFNHVCDVRFWQLRE